MREPEGMEDARRIRPSESTKQGSYELTELNITAGIASPAGIASTWVCTRSSEYRLLFSA